MYNVNKFSYILWARKKTTYQIIRKLPEPHYLLLKEPSPKFYSTLHFRLSFQNRETLQEFYALKTIGFKTIGLKTNRSKRVQQTFKLCFVEFL